MPSSSVHPLSVRPFNAQNLLTTTPAANKLQNFNTHRTLQKTAGPKPREFDIYIDHNSSSPSELDLIPTKSKKKATLAPSHQNLIQTKQSISTRLATSTKKISQKPLEDKTNTVRKKLSRVRTGDQQEQSPTDHKSVKPLINDNTQPILKKKPSISKIHLTPHSNKSVNITKYQSINQLSSSTKDSAKKLLYRTPVTSKRASRPPFANTPGSDTNDDEDDGEASFANSHHSINHLDFDLTQENIPDVEYGPPSAIIEPIESLIDEQANGMNALKMEEFFKHLKQDPRNYMISDDDERRYDASKGNMTTEIEEIMKSDGSKEKWTYEPKFEMTNYAVDNLLDEFLIPSGLTRQPNKPARIQPRKQQVTSSSSRNSRLLTATRSNSSSYLSGTTKPPTSLRSQSKATLSPPLTRHASKNLSKVSCSTFQTTTQPPSMPASLTQYQQLVRSLINDHHSNFQSDLDQLQSNLDNSSHFFDQDLNSFQFELIV